jgi:hypothetical protein
MALDFCLNMLSVYSLVVSGWHQAQYQSVWVQPPDGYDDQIANGEDHFVRSNSCSRRRSNRS